MSRVAFAATLALLAVIFAMSSRSASDVPAARFGHRVELVHLIATEEERVAALRSQADELAKEVASFEQARPDERAAGLRKRIEALAPHAGVTPLEGTGITVTLDDSPLQTSPSGDLNDLVIHEEDLQAVINALWAGGAEGISVQGERILATTAIRCVGNTLLLHGAVHSPPYVIEAVGGPEQLRGSLEDDIAVQWLSSRVDEFQIGFTTTQGDLVLPAFEGATRMRVAEPVRG